MHHLLIKIRHRDRIKKYVLNCFGPQPTIIMNRLKMLLFVAECLETFSTILANNFHSKIVIHPVFCVDAIYFIHCVIKQALSCVTIDSLTKQKKRITVTLVLMHSLEKVRLWIKPYIGTTKRTPCNLLKTILANFVSTF